MESKVTSNTSTADLLVKFEKIYLWPWENTEMQWKALEKAWAWIIIIIIIIFGEISKVISPFHSRYFDSL